MIDDVICWDIRVRVRSNADGTIRSLLHKDYNHIFEENLKVFITQPREKFISSASFDGFEYGRWHMLGQRKYSGDEKICV